MLGKTFPPYKYKGSRRLRVSNQSNIQLLSFLSFLLALIFQSTIWCSSVVSTSIEGVLGGLPILEQSCVRLPRWVLPGQCSLVIDDLPGDKRSDRSLSLVWPVWVSALQRVSLLATRSTVFVCWWCKSYCDAIVNLWTWTWSGPLDWWCTVRSSWAIWAKTDLISFLLC